MNLISRRSARLGCSQLVKSVAVLFVLASPGWGTEPVSTAATKIWPLVQTWPAPEAIQAAAADQDFFYAINNTSVAKYRRDTGERVAISRGSASHLNSGLLWQGHVYCAHSNYPVRPEHSEIKRLDIDSMQLETFHSFGASDGSLTWVLRRDNFWWCHFAYYGNDNGKSYLSQWDDDWKEVRRWTLPDSVVEQLGRYSLSGGVWDGPDLLVTGHDDPLVFRLRLPKTGSTLEFAGTESVPFTGQGIAIDPVTLGLVGIHRGQKQLRLASRPSLERQP